MLNVHLRFTDAATKLPLPVRLRIFRPDGGTFTPLGRLPIFPCGRGEAVGGQVRVGSENSAYIDGGCEVPLPAGVPIRIVASHGPEYETVDREVTLKPGQMALRFELNRWADSEWTGWLKADSHAHFLSPHAAALEGAAEGLDAVHLLAQASSMLAQDGNTYPTIHNLTDFSGQSAALTAHGCEVFVNTLNAHPSLGKLSLLNSHRPIFPLNFGGHDGPDDWSLCDWADQCHRKKGLVAWVDAFRPECGLLGGEALAALILGKIDAIEFDSQPRSQPFLPWYYRLLNAGLRVPLVGGSGKESNRTALGSMRTYALPTDAAPSWIDAVRAGRTFITNGPLLKLDFDGTTATGSAVGNARFEKLELIGDGRVLASAAAEPGERCRAALSVPIPADAGGWLAARCIGGAPSKLYPGSPVFAHSSPIYRAGPAPDRIKSVEALVKCLGATRDWVEAQGRFSSAKAKDHLLANCAAAAVRLAEFRAIP